VSVPLGGAAVVVLGGETPAGGELVRGLERLGASVAGLGVDALWSAGAVEDALGGAERRMGAVDGVVLCSVGAEPPSPRALVDLDPASWDAQVERPLRRTLACFQGVHRHLRRRGGSVVLITPTLSLTGAAGLVPWSAVAEGQRALAKAAARSWGRHGVTVNCVAVPGALLVGGAGSPSGGGGLDRPGLPAPALPSPDMGGDVARVVGSLLCPEWRSVTGMTVPVDGGVWMAP